MFGIKGDRLKVLFNAANGFFKDSSIYFVVNMLNKAIPFVLLPIITGIVSAEEYGKYALFMTTIMVLRPLIGLSLESGITKHFFDFDASKLKVYFSNILKFQLGFSSFLFFVFFLLLAGDTVLFGLEKELLLLALLCAGLTAIFNNLSAYLIVKKLAILYGKVIISNSLVLFLLIIFLLQYIPNSVGIIYGRFITAVLFVVIAFFIFKRHNLLSRTFDQPLFKKAVNYSTPVIFHSFSAIIFIASDRYLIEYFLGTEQVGYYSVIFQISSIISIVAASMNAAWVPWIFEKLKRNDEGEKKEIVKFSYALKAGFVVLGAVFCLFVPLIVKLLLKPEYYDYVDLSPFFVCGFILQGLYFVVVPYIFYTEKTRYLAYYSFTASLFNIVLNLYLIPIYGLHGAAFASVISWGILYILTFAKSVRLYSMPWLTKS